MNVTICDLCKSQITGIPQGEGKGNPAIAKNIVFFDGDRETPIHNEYEVCWTCFEQVKAGVEALRNTAKTTTIQPSTTTADVPAPQVTGDA